MILITHEHGDHLDPKLIKDLRTEKTVLVLTEKCTKKVEGGIIMKNGDVQTIEGIQIEAVPAYNLVHKSDNGQPFHPKGVGNGYVRRHRYLSACGSAEGYPGDRSAHSQDEVVTRSGVMSRTPGPIAKDFPATPQESREVLDLFHSP